MNLPNALSLSRIATVPLFLYLAWTGRSVFFLLLLAIVLPTDILDGYIARRRGQTSDSGARLDSWGDFALYAMFPIYAWLLFPELITRDLPWVLLAVAAYMLPPMMGFAKFGQLPSYHTWASKISAMLMSLAVFFLLTEISPLPFKCMALLQSLVATEQMAITAVLAKPLSNVGSLYHLIRNTNDCPSNLKSPADGTNM